MFSFNHEKYDFWPVYDCIKKYYPIGIPKDDTGLYKSYSGIRSLEKIIIDNIHDEHKFTSGWEAFEKAVEYRTHKIVYGTTSGQTPCFSSFIELERRAAENLTRIREIHFFVSLTGPFYTVLGHDRSEIVLEDDKVYATNFLAISPENEYKELFELICLSIEEKFAGYRFVPYGIYSQRIEGLDIHYTGYTGEKLNTIFNALFNNHVDIGARTIGKGFFKSADWIIEGYDFDNDDRWNSYSKK
ncbi:MAG: hypothetical protein P4L51_04190 [Puia sp.]|nr:hypothetical protein [Puia sp.]